MYHAFTVREFQGLQYLVEHLQHFVRLSSRQSPPKVITFDVRHQYVWLLFEVQARFKKLDYSAVLQFLQRRISRLNRAKALSLFWTNALGSKTFIA